MPAVECVCIRDEDGFHGLADDWIRLTVRTDQHCVFFRHEWFDAAWLWLNDACSLFIVCVSRERELIGICPLMLRRSTVAQIEVTVLEFLAVPDTQECGLLADPAALDDVVSGMIDCLSSEEHGFAAPLASWFRGPLRERIRKVVLSAFLAETGFFDMRFVQCLLDQHQSGRSDHSAVWWSLLMFEAYQRRLRSCE